MICQHISKDTETIHNDHIICHRKTDIERRQKQT